LPDRRFFGQITQKRPLTNYPWLETIGGRTMAEIDKKWQKLRKVAEKYFYNDLNEKPYI
jgi:hypothetical protein